MVKAYSGSDWPSTADQDLIYTVEDNDRCVYLRDVLKYRMSLSRSLISRLKAEHRISVNGRHEHTNYPVKPGDRVHVDVRFEETNYVEPRDIPLDIVYEDPDFLVINKPAGLMTHPGADASQPSLAAAVINHWNLLGMSLRFRPVNRLDKNTSGLLLVAQSHYAHQAAFQQLKAGRIKRRYSGLVEGWLPPGEDTIDRPITHIDPGNNAVRSVSWAGKAAVTEYRVMEAFPRHTLLSFELKSGRSHQIRVHMSSIGHPICGDWLYGGSLEFIGRQALHAGSLGFLQARTGEAVEVHAPLPPDISLMLEQIRKL